MNVEDVRLFTLSLDGVTEDMPFGDDIVVFRVEGKIFLGLWLGFAEPRFAVKLPPERNEELRGLYDAVTPAWHWNKKHWSDVYYELMEPEMVEEWIREAHRLIISKLPKRLRGKYVWDEVG